MGVGVSSAALSNVPTVNEILQLIWDTSAPITFPSAFLNEAEPDQSQKDNTPSLCALGDLRLVYEQIFMNQTVFLLSSLKNFQAPLPVLHIFKSSLC